MQYWERFRYLVRRQNTTQEWVAKQIPVSVRTFQGWVLRNKLPDAGQSVAIAKALDSTVEYMVTGDDGTPNDIRDIVSDLRKLPEDQLGVIAVQIRALVEMRQSKESKTG